MNSPACSILLLLQFALTSQLASANNSCGVLRAVDSFEMLEQSRDSIAEAIENQAATYLTGRDPKTGNAVKILIVEPSSDDYDSIVHSLSKAENTVDDWQNIKRGCSRAIKTCAIAATTLIAGVGTIAWGARTGDASILSHGAFLLGALGATGGLAGTVHSIFDFFGDTDVAGGDSSNTAAIQKKIATSIGELSKTGDPLVFVSRSKLNSQTLKNFQSKFGLIQSPAKEFFEDIMVTDRKYFDVELNSQRPSEIRIPYFDEKASMLITPESSFDKSDLNFMADILDIPILVSKNKVESFAKRSNARMIYGFEAGHRVPFGYFFRSQDKLKVFIWEHYTPKKKSEIIERLKKSLQLKYNETAIPEVIDDSFQREQYLTEKRGIEKRGEKLVWVHSTLNGTTRETDVSELLDSAENFDIQ